MRDVLDAFELPRWSRATFCAVVLLCAELFVPHVSGWAFRLPILIAAILGTTRERNAIWLAQFAIEQSRLVEVDGWTKVASLYANTVTPIAATRFAHILHLIH